ncbi:MAG: AzlD domain-containing protein [Anaerolineae bacterium]|nr:AzlD domain-containing protein [Anaerolineae bacterium]
MNEPLMILGMMLVTFLPRYGVLALLGRMEMPRPLFRALRFVPPAVLAAIILPSMLLKEGELDLTLQNSFLFAGIIAALVSWRSKNLLLTIVVGMVALLIWRAIFPAIQ